jgi:transposase
MPRARKYPEELLERATRLVFESGRPIAHVARDLGLPAETLRVYVRRTEAGEGKRKDVLSSQEREEIKALRREVAQLRRANEILKAASVSLAGELDPHRRSTRAIEDERLLSKIEALHEANYLAYGSRACGRRCSGQASRSAAIASRG